MTSKVPPRELKPRGILVLPCQNKAEVQAEEAEEDELDVYETVGQSVTALSNDDQKTRQKSFPRRGSTQSLNIVFPEETNEQERFSGDDFENPKRAAAPPIARKPSHGTIRRRRNTWHQSTDTVQLREIEQTQKPGSPIPSTEREQATHPYPLFQGQSCQDMIQVPKQKPEKYIAIWDYEPRTQDEIELKEGNVVTVLEKCSTDWFLAEVRGRRGYIPGYYVKKAEDKNPGGDLANELEAVLRRRRTMSEKSSSEEE